MDVGTELLKLWLVGMFFSWIINLWTSEPNEEKTMARWTFNIVMWPIAILVLCLKGGLEHLPNPKRKK